jgi:hypothetical protein
MFHASQQWLYTEVNSDEIKVATISLTEIGVAVILGGIEVRVLAMFGIG